ncbi:unnamed protein product, partial [Prorocentrum cordatum]
MEDSEEAGAVERVILGTQRVLRSTSALPTRAALATVVLAEAHPEAQKDCVRLCFSRLTCSWFCKLLLLVAITQGLLLWGPLSNVFWIPTHPSRGCEQSLDEGGGPEPFMRGNAHSLAGCQQLCEAAENCSAVDWFNQTRYCNLYDRPCLIPVADWDGAASYQVAEDCTLDNGSVGILIGGGVCDIDIQRPTFISLVKEGALGLLFSPLSWSFSLAVAFLYTCVASAWCRQCVKLGCSDTEREARDTCAASCCRRLCCCVQNPSDPGRRLDGGLLRRRLVVLGLAAHAGAVLRRARRRLDHRPAGRPARAAALRRVPAADAPHGVARLRRLRAPAAARGVPVLPRRRGVLRGGPGLRPHVGLRP